ncbi:hypothetical protein ABFS83_14G182800 [Erythranthe nasuta]
MLRLLLSSHHRTSRRRCISTTASLSSSWIDKMKGFFTGESSPKSFTLLRYADEMRKARKLEGLKPIAVGRRSDATFADAFEKQEAVIRYLGRLDPTGENIQTSQKMEAAKQCNCTILVVESAFAKFTWAKEAQKKMDQLKAEGKPMPKSLSEVQKLMGSSPLDVARLNMAKSGQISRNSPCPCGSKKLYKRCCGKDNKSS